MGVLEVQRFSALLSLLALSGAVLFVLLRVLGLRSGTARALGAALEPLGLWLAFAVAATATLGSLYFSEVANFTPCRLCWFQRIAMFPLAVTLLVAAVRRDRGVRWYVVPQALLGLCVSVYHYVIEWFPQLEKTSCEVTAPCTAVWFREFGFVSLAFMAGSGFLAVLALLLVRFER
jgi:disulfide bond formation protein DsbB